MKENKRRWLSNSLKFILLFVMVIVIWLFIAYLTGIKLTIIVFWSIILAMFMSIVVNIFDLDKDLKKDPQQRRHIVARYKFKGLWYLIATIATIVFMIDELRSPSDDGVLILNSVLVFIVLYECIDNYKSYSVENNKLKSADIIEKNETDDVNKIEKLENELSDLKAEVDSLKSNNLSEGINSGAKASTVRQKSFLIAVIIMVGIIKSQARK